MINKVITNNQEKVHQWREEKVNHHINDDIKNIHNIVADHADHIVSLTQVPTNNSGTNEKSEPQIDEAKYYSSASTS